MKKLRLCCLLGTTLAALPGCIANSHLNSPMVYGACAPDGPTLRTVTDARGILTYDTRNQEYRISLVEPGSTGAADVGIICGTLPYVWKRATRKVIFSGNYKAYEAAPPAAGPPLYRLEVTSLAAQ